MSHSSASLAHGSDTLIPPSYAPDDGDADGASYARNGSMVSKLFAKNRPQVAVDEDAVQSPLNGQEDDDDEGNSDEERDDGDEIDANGNGYAHGADDDEDDDEFVPGSSDDDSGESDDEADVGDLDDEETSMRSLLLPMATYAKQLLFLSEEDDDGEFDVQDAELWASPEEKREWIDRYEAQNRAYIDQYGCRIDAPAIPDLKKRLRRERDREAKYSLVLLALALAYLVRLLVGPTTTPSIDSTSPVATPSVQSPIDDSLVNTPTPQSTQEWASSSPPWWTVWTEDLVVRVFAWPQSMVDSLQSAILASSPRKHERGDPPPSSDSSPNERAPSVEDPISSTAPITGAPTLSHPLESDDGTVEDLAASTPDEVPVEREVIALEPLIPASDGGPEGTASDVETATPTETRDQRHVIDVNDNDSPVQVPAHPDSSDSTDTEVVSAESKVEVEKVSVTSHETQQDADLNKALSEETPEEEELTRDTEVDQREKAAEVSLQRCLDMFYMLVKMKHDASVKVAAVSECDQAVEAAAQSTAPKQIQARLLRGDMKSLLQLFTEANEDYEAALSSENLESTTLRSEIEIKVASNRWIGYYHRKQYKELRSDCQRLRDSTTSGSPDRVRELAVEWLRAFRKETTILEVLTKTRAWTLYRPAAP